MPDKRTFHFDVTQACIDKGVHLECTQCPVALAMLNAGFTGVSITDLTCSGSLNGTVWSSRTPHKVVSFIERFDDGELTEPFSFDLEMTAQ